MEELIDPLYLFHAEIRRFLGGQGIPPERVELSIPPDTRYGDAATNIAFLVAKEQRRSPRNIAEDIAEEFKPAEWRFLSRVEAAGAGFINFYLDDEELRPHVLSVIEDAGRNFGGPQDLEPGRLLIEHTSVNPNKEWHVGHLRNVVLGDVLARLSRLQGRTVEVQNYIDDTGRQAAEAIYALQYYTDESHEPGEKYDHYVGRLYVRLNGELSSEAEKNAVSELAAGVESVLHEMDSGKFRAIVEAILEAQLKTAARIGATYDLLVWESDIVGAHLLEEALNLLKQSPRVFVPADGKFKGALVLRLDSPSSRSEQEFDADEDSALRVLVRSNGVPTYTGKDIAYMMWKFGLLSSKLNTCQFLEATGRVTTTCPHGEPYVPVPPDRVINVVAEHQALQQHTVIEGLAAAGFPTEASRAYHLSYGLVSQAHGRISGRKGTGISADDVIDDAVGVARERIDERREGLDLAEKSRIAEAIGVGAIRYLMIQNNPAKPIVFDMQDVVNFEGNTGLYVQYAMVRIGAVMRRARELGIDDEAVAVADPQLLTASVERTLLLKLGRFPAVLEDASRTLAVNLLAEYAHSLASEFSQFYRDCPIIQSDAPLRLARLRLLEATRIVLRNAMSLIGIPVVEQL